MQNWNNRFLSCGCKEVPFKSVVQSIPVYGMSCFCQLPGFMRLIELWQTSGGVIRVPNGRFIGRFEGIIYVFLKLMEGLVFGNLSASILVY